MEPVQQVKDTPETARKVHVAWNPGRWVYALAVVLIVLAAASFVQVMVSATGRITAMQRVTMPGEVELELSESGPYIVFYEHRSEIDGQVVQTSTTPPALRLSLARAEDDAAVQLDPPLAVMPYSTARFEGASLYEFTLRDPGRYRLTGMLDGGGTVVLAIGPGEEPGSIPGVFVGLCMAFALGMAGMVLATLAAFMRSANRRYDAARAEAERIVAARSAGEDDV